ncbi:hypothetical protein SUGI_0978430 [Cryptomeria japonica]|nr:hypothetical protein SUGI_0978430 [Cryptomeria japonica]
MAAPPGLLNNNEEDLSAKALQKRYEGLVTVRSKAIKGKGAWYWVHLEPILVQNQETGAAKAVKLRCGLCSALFSASNPSRTASEHLKRGTCPNFNGSIPRPIQAPSSKTPISMINPASTSTSSQQQQNRKRTLTQSQALTPLPLTMIGAELVSPPAPLMLSGGKEDLGALAMLEDSVKKLKSPGGKGCSPSQALSKVQIDSALNLLAEWLYESCGTVSLSCVEHPKFKAFLSQLASDGWKRKSNTCNTFSPSSSSSTSAGESLVNLTLNLPNGTSLFRKAVFTNGGVVGAKYVEETLWETITGICGTVVERCVGIVADTDRLKSKALSDLEDQNRWMVNLPCQFQGFSSLLKDFHKHLGLFRSVAMDCWKLATFFNGKNSARSYFQKYQMQEMDHVSQIRVPPDPPLASGNYMYVYAMIEDIANSARALQLTVLDDAYKVIYAEDPHGREAADMIRDMRFWNDLDAVLSLVKLVKMMVQEIETERPLVGQCLPLWEDLRTKVKDWCAKYNVEEGPVEEVIEKRFAKNYHPAWSAAFILDPLYLLRDNSGKYLPPFKFLTQEQEKDVDRLITRLVSREEAHIALMELMKWRAEGLDPLYAQAVQVKQRDPITGKMKIANPQSSRLVWETCLSEFKALGKVAVRLIFLHATSCGLKCNWSFMRWVYTHGHSRAAMDRVQKMIFIASHARLERRDFVNEEEKDAELFANGMANYGQIFNILIIYQVEARRWVLSLLTMVTMSQNLFSNEREQNMKNLVSKNDSEDLQKKEYPHTHKSNII